MHWLIKRFYFWLKFIYNWVLFGNKFYSVPLPKFHELGLDEYFVFNPWGLQYPWVIDFMWRFFEVWIKPVILKQVISKMINNDYRYGNYYWKFDKFFGDPLYVTNVFDHNILKWLAFANFYFFTKNVQTFIFETVWKFFVKKNFYLLKWYLAKIVKKKWKSKKKRKKLSLNVSNDLDFFWPITSEYEVNKGPFRLIWKPGWPKKWELFYFTFEAEIFENMLPWKFMYTNTQLYWFYIRWNQYRSEFNKKFIFFIIVDEIFFSLPKPF